MNVRHVETGPPLVTEHVDELFELAPAAIVLSELQPPRIVRVNREFTRMFGYTPEEAVGRSLRQLIAPGELETGFARNSGAIAAGERADMEVVRQRKDGARIHVHLTAAGVKLRDGATAAYLIYRDISERKHAERLLVGENRVLEMIANGSPLTIILDTFCRLFDELSPGFMSSVLLLEPAGNRLRTAAAPHLPREFVEAVDAAAVVGPADGSCGTAAYRGKPVIVTDIVGDPLWAKYGDVPFVYGLRACWSMPILSGAHKVLGTFGIYSRQPRAPTPQQLSIIEQFTHLASITVERKQAEEALRRSEERFALAMSAAGEGHWDWNITTDEFYASPRMVEMYGFPPGTAFASRAEFIEKFPFHPDDRPKWEAAAAAHFAGTTARFDIEIRMIPRGEVRWIHLTGMCCRDASGTPVRWTGSVADITERKCVQDALRLSEERYALAMEATGDGHWDWNIASDDFYVSPLLLDMCGLPAETPLSSREEFIRRFPFHADDRAKWEAATAAHLQGDTERFELDIRIVPRGELRWIHLTGLCSRDSAGHALRWAGSVTDITESKHAESALLESERQLRQAQRLEAMGTLAGGIAHDFNNILGAILGYGEMALRDAPATTRLRRDIDSIISAGERGRALVDRILAFSRSGVGERVAVHVEEIVHEALDLLSAKLPPNIRIEARLCAGRAAMLGDATQVHQVLMNLAMNGVQAMSRGGLLRVSLSVVRFDTPRAATIGTIAAADYVMLEVADDGSGIAPDVLDRIFDPFFTTKDVGVGTGLGLSLVHGIVTELGGSIDVASTPGAGSVFSVYFPHAGDATADPRAQAAPAVPHGAGERVLVVDDEEALVALTTRTLEELGYAPAGFTSPAAALGALRAEPQRFDAVITDERMPGMSGSALIREVRAISRSIPILLVSGYLGGLVVRRAYNSGATEVLRKPLSMPELAASLARALNP